MKIKKYSFIKILEIKLCWIFGWHKVKDGVNLYHNSESDEMKIFHYKYCERCGKNLGT